LFTGTGAALLSTLDDALELLQMAIEFEFSTFYALYSIMPGTNAEASRRIRFVAMERVRHAPVAGGKYWLACVKCLIPALVID
jgi:hypothetical protein